MTIVFIYLISAVFLRTIISKLAHYPYNQMHLLLPLKKLRFEYSAPFVVVTISTLKKRQQKFHTTCAQCAEIMHVKMGELFKTIVVSN